MTGRWELVSGNSAKFWEITRSSAAVTVRFGRLGAAGQTQTKELPSEAAAQAHVAKLVAEKEKKGYRSVTTAAEAAQPAGGSQATPAFDASPAALSAETPPADGSATEAPSPTTSPTEPPPLHEATWVMPADWLAQAMPRRDAQPLPAFTPDQAVARKFRDHIAAGTAKISEALTSPDHDPELLRALRHHVEGRPDPLGAATLVKLLGVEHGTSPVHWWIEDFGLPFAATAAIHHATIYDSRGRLLINLPRHSPEHSAESRVLIDIRTALAVADEATYDATVTELEKIGTNWFGQVARAFLVPTRHDWFEEANQSSSSYWMVHSSASTPDHLSRLKYGHLIWSETAVYTALHLLGPSLAPVLEAELRAKAEWGGEHRRLALDVLAALPTDEAFLMLLNRLQERYVRPALAAAMEAFPARALRLMTPRAANDADVRNLLRAHLVEHPGLPVADELTALVEVIPEAPVEALPPILAEPPWTRRRPQAKPVVLQGLPVPEAHLTWSPGEREEWSAVTGWWSRQTGDWESMAEAIRTGKGSRYDHRLFEAGPEEIARPLLAVWTPNDTWNSESWGKRIAARFGIDALPAMLRLAASNPHVSGVVLLPYATPEVAALMADWFVRLKTARAFALSWLARHREAAARLLLPVALGAAGTARRNAEFALRHLHLEIGVDVIALAPAPEAGAAIRTLIEVDPLDVLPAKLPAIGGWADLRLLPQVLLANGAGALPADAAKSLLTTVALSKQDAVYPGLPLAVEACDRTSLAEFAWALFGLWQDAGAPSRDGWVLTALAWFGDDETARRLAPLIRAWPGESQHARAVAGLDVLAQIGSEVALMNLNSIAERVKFKGLKAKAQEKVTDIAAALGLSRDQLSDRLVPRLDLDEAASLVIDYGPRQFTVGFDEQLKPYVLDAEGKRRKDLPKPGARDDQELAPAEHKRFATLKKDVRAIASDQIHRLERSMVDQRTWTTAEFHAVLAAHPLLWHLVRRLVWITDTGLTFRLAEDRTLADASDDEVTLPGNAVIRVAHPIDLADTLPAWGEVFADYEILQPFPQLGRPTHAFAPGDTLPQLAKYLNRDVPVGKVLGLTKHGWARCQPQDNGVEPWMTRPLPSGGALVAALDPGIIVGMVDMEPEMRFSALWFDPDGAGAWSPPGNGTPTTFEVDAITASELLSELESLHA
ncbi:DUF4132 domain-containing protein [Lentzea sp. HUAS12]|uniref:DUF4132 domain-containing protein n=1 Tax=Lentzea sp. HUAS12 TaxID=2951806 RepID=UPI00209E7CBF|nr:DUF4132 domain-containing protein [Lentzea sp. HUAS12]USX55664.1 DUF4132 domain-containing protein [Lentzea sp. HUAS12]